MNPIQNRDFNPGGAFYATRKLRINGRDVMPGQELDPETIQILAPGVLRTLWANSQVTQVRPNKDAVRSADLAPFDVAAEVRDRKAASAALDRASAAATSSPNSSADDVRKVIAADAPAMPSERSPAEMARAAAESLETGRRLFTPDRTPDTVKAAPQSTDVDQRGDEVITAVDTPTGKKAKK